MKLSKEELMECIEAARYHLDESIEQNDLYEKIYRYSVELDGLIEQYIVAGY